MRVLLITYQIQILLNWEGTVLRNNLVIIYFIKILISKKFFIIYIFSYP